MSGCRYVLLSVKSGRVQRILDLVTVTASCHFRFGRHCANNGSVSSSSLCRTTLELGDTRETAMRHKGTPRLASVALSNSQNFPCGSPRSNVLIQIRLIQSLSLDGGLLPPHQGDMQVARTGR